MITQHATEQTPEQKLFDEMEKAKREVFAYQLRSMKTTVVAVKNIKGYFKALTTAQMKDNLYYHDHFNITLVFDKVTGDYLTMEWQFSSKPRLDLENHIKVLINSRKKRTIYKQIDFTVYQERNFNLRIQDFVAGAKVLKLL